MRFFKTIKCLAFILALHVTMPSFSQKDNFNGYFISRSGDTVRGHFARYKQWFNNPDNVKFTTAAGNEVDLTPLNSKQFVVEGYDTYLSYQGTRLKNPISFNATISTTNVDMPDTVSTFLRQIAITSQYKFYVFRDKVRVNLFYVNSSSSVINELQQKAALVNNVFWQSMEYQQQLKELFPGEKQKVAIQLVTYTEESLSSFVKRQEGGSQPYKVRSKNNGLFVTVGASMNSIKFTADRSLEFTTNDFASQIVPLGAIGYIISINRNFDRLFIFPELKIFSFKQTTKVVYNGSYPTFYNTFKSSLVLSLVAHVGYNFVSNPNLKIAFAPGAGLAYFSNNMRVAEAKVSATDSRFINTSMNSLSPFTDLKVMAIVMKHGMIWGSYNLPVLVTDLTTTKGKLSTIQFGVGYKF